MEERELLKKAKKRVKVKKVFYLHLLTFSCVSLFLFIINYLTSPNFWWFLFPLVSWGMVVAGHGIFMLGKSRGWEEKELEKELHRLKQEEDYPREEADLLSLEDDRLELKERTILKKELDEEDFV